jgi:cytochrome c-type biogenesis protein CcmE
MGENRQIDSNSYSWYSPSYVFGRTLRRFPDNQDKEAQNMTGKTKFIAAGLLIVAAVVYLIVSSTGSTAHYFLTIEELQTMGNETTGRNVTVSGAVLGDTIIYDSSVPRVIFTVVQIPGDPGEVERAGGLAKVLHDAVSNPNAPRLEVVYDDVKPDLLQNEAQAIMRGQLGEDGRFYADEVLLKCPTRYEEDVPDQAGEN